MERVIKILGIVLDEDFHLPQIEIIDPVEPISPIIPSSEPNIFNTPVKNQNHTMRIENYF